MKRGQTETTDTVRCAETCTIKYVLRNTYPMTVCFKIVRGIVRVFPADVIWAGCRGADGTNISLTAAIFWKSFELSCNKSA